jgi:hypothetical protein
MEDTKTAAQAEKGYTDKTQGYAAEASTSHPILYHLGKRCWNLVHVAHLVNSKACTIIVPYCQDKERLPCLNMGVSYHSKIDACERKGDC